jgi:hypothetical protein
VNDDRLPARRRPAKRAKVALLTLDDLDRRTAAFANVQSTISALTADMAHEPSAAEKMLIQRAAVLGAVLADCETRWIKGDGIDAKDYCTVVNAQRRTLETIGIRRGQRDVSVPTLDQIAEELAREANDDEL